MAATTSRATLNLAAPSVARRANAKASPIARAVAQKLPNSVSSSFTGVRPAIRSSVRHARSAFTVSAGADNVNAVAVEAKTQQLVLPIDLRGKRAFVAGVADDQGFGWAISKSLAQAGCEVILGTWVPALNIFESSYRRGKFDENRVLSDGSLMEFKKVYAMDAVFDKPADVPEEVATNKRYAKNDRFTVSEVAEQVAEDFGTIDFVVHSLANGPEVMKPLLETSRAGYLAAMSASSYSLISLVQAFAPIMNPGGAIVALSYLAGERVIPGYGGGMSTAKAALESDTKVLAYELGHKYGLRINTVSAGPLGSRAARAIGFIDDMIKYSSANAALPGKELEASEVGNTCAFLLSPLASAITGTTLYVDHGLHVMGVALDSPIFAEARARKAESS